MSPILFNIVVNMLTLLIKRAKDNGQFSGILSHLVDEGFFVFQSEDNTMIVIEHDLEQAKNMKL